jgi:hypothetical protein
MNREKAGVKGTESGEFFNLEVPLTHVFGLIGDR